MRTVTHTCDFCQAVTDPGTMVNLQLTYNWGTTYQTFPTRHDIGTLEVCRPCFDARQKKLYALIKTHEDALKAKTTPPSTPTPLEHLENWITELVDQLVSDRLPRE